jgi:hypothetical protein
MNKKQRQHIRAIANGEVYQPLRKPPMPLPKIYQLKNRYRRYKKISEVDFDG